jgi:hypothetical protein
LIVTLPYSAVMKLTDKPTPRKRTVAVTGN